MARIRYKEAVGIEVRLGRPPAGSTPTKDQLVKLYVRESRSVRDVAAVLGCSKDSVHWAMKEYGIEARPKAKRSQLRKYRLDTLEKGIREKGLRGYALELRIHENTLRHYLKGAKGTK